jgi:hypothetical protein
MLICIIIVIILGLAVSCAPVDTSTTTTKTNVEGYGMKLMAEQDDIQVWRMVDHLSATCYITINSQRYQPAEIFCLK